MKSAFLFGGVMVVGGVMALVGGVDLGRMSAPAFNYDNATSEERAAFLETEAKPFAKALKIGLVNPSGVGTTMRLADTKLNARQREIIYVIKVQGGMQTGGKFSQAREAFLKRMCPKYVDSRLGKANVRMVQKFVGKGDRTLNTITVSTSKCSQYL